MRVVSLLIIAWALGVIAREHQNLAQHLNGIECFFVKLLDLWFVVDLLHSSVLCHFLKYGVIVLGCLL